MTSCPAGSWPSPITPEALVGGATGISELVLSGNDVLWAESRPDEGGRVVIMRRGTAEGASPPHELTAADTNVRTLVHEYGGGAWWADDSTLWYCNHRDQRIHQLPLDAAASEPRALTPESSYTGAYRFADMRPAFEGAWLIAVMERHPFPEAENGNDPSTADQHGGHEEPENLLVAIATDGSERIRELAIGADFYSSPRISPDGRTLAWIEWWHPNMPWDETHLQVATLKLVDGEPELTDQRLVAGGAESGIAILQPEWSADNRLHYVSDAVSPDHGDTWQLYVEGESAPVHVVAGELGYPPWVFGLSRYALHDDGSIAAARFESGLEFLDGTRGNTARHSAFHAVRSRAGHTAWVGASFKQSESVYFDGRMISSPVALGIDEAFFTPPESLHFPTGPSAALDTGNATELAHALYYAPAHPEFQLADKELPPLIVIAHGGPTSAARSRLNLGIRFWTSRGYGVVDVNYRGSSGFGRAYRKRLDGEWGIVDVEDCVAVARYLVARGSADPKRLIIRGGSAGGFTVLCALAFHDTFTAGASLYGVADLEALAGDTHKFESRYLDSLVGPYPQARATYRARSPIHHLDNFNTPMIVLQGSEDKIVPPNQSRAIVAALEARGVTVEYHEYEGEQHGFRKADTIKQALESELAFYTRLFKDDESTGVASAPGALE